MKDVISCEKRGGANIVSEWGNPHEKNVSIRQSITYGEGELKHLRAGYGIDFQSSGEKMGRAQTSVRATGGSFESNGDSFGKAGQKGEHMKVKGELGSEYHEHVERKRGPPRKAKYSLVTDSA